MKLEHIALNVSNPPEIAKWYVQNLGMEIVSQQASAPFTHFLADDSGRVMIEMYNRPPDAVPDYFGINHLNLHLAFVSEEPEQDRTRLEAAGATHVEDLRPTEGTLLVMMRDPWGVPIQLCRRAKTLLRAE